MSRFRPHRLLTDLISFVHPTIPVDIDDKHGDQFTADFDADSDVDALVVDFHPMMQSETQEESNFMSFVGPLVSLVRLTDTIIH